MWHKKRHSIITAILRPFFKLYFKIAYKCKIKRTKAPKEGAIILANHSTTLDPFICGSIFDKPLYYMASKDLFDHFFTGKLIKFLVNPIPKEKSNKSDLNAIKDCITVAKENQNICIFPEGNRTFCGQLGYIDPTIVKLIKKLKKPLYIVNIKGGYNTDPRWGYKLRKGKMEAFVKQIYSYEDIIKMDNNTLYELIINNLTVEDMNDNIKYKGKNQSNYLERIIYICPKCGKLHTFFSWKDYLRCGECGLIVKHNPNLTLSSNWEEFGFKYVKDWYNYQIEQIKKASFDDNQIIYQDKIQVFEPRMYKTRKKLGKGKMLLTAERFIFELDKQTYNLSYD